MAAMPNYQNDQEHLAALVNQFASFSRDRDTLKGHHLLQESIDTAVQILSDEAKQAIHERVREIVWREFERCRQFNFPHNTEETRELHLRNFHLFDEPSFEIDFSKFVDDERIALSILWLKPKNKWTAKEHQYYEAYILAEARKDLAKRFFR